MTIFVFIFYFFIFIIFITFILFYLNSTFNFSIQVKYFWLLVSFFDFLFLITFLKYILFDSHFQFSISLGARRPEVRAPLLLSAKRLDNIRLTCKSVRAQRGLARNLRRSEATAGCVTKGFIRLKRLLDCTIYYYIHFQILHRF